METQLKTYGNTVKNIIAKGEKGQNEHFSHFISMISN